ncbi:MAG: hypothetical protein ACYS74_11295, partial [Planctomycetota bacterium]
MGPQEIEKHAKERQAVRARRCTHGAAWYIILVLIWTAGGMLVWTGALKPLLTRRRCTPLRLGAATQVLLLTFALF